MAKELVRSFMLKAGHLEGAASTGRRGRGAWGREARRAPSAISYLEDYWRISVREGEAQDGGWGNRRAEQSTGWTCWQWRAEAVGRVMLPGELVGCRFDGSTIRAGHDRSVN